MRYSHSGSGYAYVTTRIKAMKSLLLPRDSYPKLMKMSLSEVIRFLEDHDYQREIDELAVRYTGINLIEYALMRNMSGTFTKVLKLSVGSIRPLLGAYLKRWDIWNIKTLIRGKYAHAPEMEILANLVPAGEYDEEFFKAIITKTTTVEDVIEAFRATEYYAPLTQALPSYQATNNLAQMEDALDRFYFSMISGIAEGKLALYIALETDTLNILMLLRMKNIDAPTTPEMFLGNGKKFSRDDLVKLSQLDYPAIIDEVNHKHPSAGITPEDDLATISSRLNRARKLQAKKLLIVYRMNIDPILGYLTAKKIEVDNLRVITRGKHAGLPEELMERQLII